MAKPAARMELSHGDHVIMLSAFLRACNLDLVDFPLSYSTSYRRRKKETEDKTDETRDNFQRDVVQGNWPLFVHLDGKELSDSIGPLGAGKKKESLGVVVLRPCLKENSLSEPTLVLMILELLITLKGSTTTLHLITAVLRLEQLHFWKETGDARY